MFKVLSVCFILMFNGFRGFKVFIVGVALAECCFRGFRAFIGSSKCPFKEGDVENTFLHTEFFNRDSTKLKP